ncbi:MAG: hypothetical protein WA802_06580 [Terracidiphilus sp.]
MNNPEPNSPDPEEAPPQGPNLVLIYSLIALALAAAIVLALLIVRPFYLRR